MLIKQPSIKPDTFGIYDFIKSDFYKEFELGSFEIDYKWNYEQDPLITAVVIQEWRNLDRLSKRFVKEGRHVLSIGGGGSSLTHEMVSEECEDFVILNPSTHDLRSAKTPNHTKNILVRGLAEKMPFLNNTFDVVEIPSTIDHVNCPDLVLEEVKRVMKIDGILVLTGGNSDSYYRKFIRNIGIKFNDNHNHFHSWHANPREIFRLLEQQGFKEVQVTTTAFLKIPKIVERKVTNAIALKIFHFLSNVLMPSVLGKNNGGMWFACARKLT